VYSTKFDVAVLFPLSEEQLGRQEAARLPPGATHLEPGTSSGTPRSQGEDLKEGCRQAALQGLGQGAALRWRRVPPCRGRVGQRASSLVGRVRRVEPVEVGYLATCNGFAIPPRLPGALSARSTVSGWRGSRRSTRRGAVSSVSVAEIPGSVDCSFLRIKQCGATANVSTLLYSSPQRLHGEEALAL